MTPTARTLAHLRAGGLLAGVVERHIHQARKTVDLFGAADVLAVHPRDRVILLVQAATAGHVADRLARLRCRPELPLLLRAGVLVEVWGWAKRSNRWEVRRVAIRAEDLEPAELTPKRRPGKRPVQREMFED
jgi:hypothetical protein